MKSNSGKEWVVLLIGGTSGIGKTSAAREIAARHGASLLELDDLRIALREVTSRQEHQELFTFVDNPDYLDTFSEEQFIEGLLQVGRGMWKAIDAIIHKHIVLGEKIVIEGDALIPELLATRDLAGVRSIFLFDGLESIRERQLSRNRHGNAAATIETNARFSLAYSNALRAQAESYGFATLGASPVETLADRVEEVLARSDGNTKV